MARIGAVGRDARMLPRGIHADRSYAAVAGTQAEGLRRSEGCCRPSGALCGLPGGLRRSNAALRGNSAAVTSAGQRAHRYEMAITRDDFLRLLAFAVGAAVDCKNGYMEGRTGGVDWSLRIAERPPRRIAALTLPVLDVALACRAADAADIDRFVERFLRAYQRAGG